MVPAGDDPASRYDEDVVYPLFPSRLRSLVRVEHRELPRESAERESFEANVVRFFERALPLERAVR